MAEQLRGPFEKFVDWRQCSALMLSCLLLRNSGALPTVHEFSKWPSYIYELDISWPLNAIQE